MDLKVTGGGRVTEVDGGEQRGGDTLMSSYIMFAIPYHMLIRATYVSYLSTIFIHCNQ